MIDTFWVLWVGLGSVCNVVFAVWFIGGPKTRKRIEGPLKRLARL